MGVLGLRAVVVREDMAQGASHRYSNRCATLAGVSDKEVKLSFVDHQPSGHSFSLNLASLSELADDAAPLIAVFREPNLGLFLKGNDGFTDFEGFQEARLCQEGKKLCRSPAVLREMFSKPRGYNSVAVCELPFLDLGKTSANVFRKGTVDGHASHSVGGVSETIEIRLGVAQALEGGRVASLHVDAYDVSGVVVHRVPEPTMAVFYESLLVVWKEAGRGWLPTVLFFGHDAGCVVLSESFLGYHGITQSLTDHLESLVPGEQIGQL